MFIAGLTQLKEIPSNVFTSLFRFDSTPIYREYHALSSSLCHVLFETHHSKIVALTFSHGKFFPRLKTSFDAFTLAYSISHSSSTALWTVCFSNIQHLEMLIEGLKCFPCKDHSGKINTIALKDKNLAHYIDMLPQLSFFTKDVTHVELSGELVSGQGKECAMKLQQIHNYFPRLKILRVASSSECLCWPILVSLSRMKNLRDVTFLLPTADIHGA